MRVRIIVMGLVLVFVSSSAFALIGPPTAELEQGQWSAGFNYQYSSLDFGKVDITEKDYDEVEGGWVLDVEDSGKYKVNIDESNTNAYFGRLSYGLIDSLDVYVQLGMADVKYKSKYADGYDEWDGFNLDNEFAWGLGGKYTFYKQEKVDWGVGAELNFFSNSMDEIIDSGTWEDGEASGTWEEKETIDIDTSSILIAVGPTIDMDGWKLYGGALFQFVNSSFESDGIESWADTEGNGGIDDKWEGEADADVSSFGGYVGASFDIAENYNMQVEFVGTGDGWGAGAGIKILF